VTRSFGVFDGETSVDGAADPAEPETLDDMSEFDVVRMARAWSVDPNLLRARKRTATSATADTGTTVT
jgi:hypothetical protein